ncbi:MAG: hypothetical protein U0263_16515 [Polyangiaceae bacterium]
MNKNLLALALVSLTAAACGNAGIPEPSLADDGAPAVAKAKPAKKAMRGDDDLPFIDELPATASAESESPFAHKEVGQVSVHRFSGSFSKTPLVLSEEVVARAGSLIVIDYTLEEGAKSTKLRVTHDASGDKVLRVREIRGKKELPSSSAAFEKMMAKTSFVPDDNEAEIGKETATCLVGDKELDCAKTAYRVRVGETLATFIVTRSSDGQDVSGEIIDGNGGILYKAELVETKTRLPAGVASR